MPADEVTIYSDKVYEVTYFPDEGRVEIQCYRPDKSFVADIEKNGGVRSTGYITLKGAQIWSWSDDGDMNGLFWARVFDYFSDVPQVLQAVFEKTPITLDDFKRMLLRDIPGIVYHVTGDNETWDGGGLFETVIDYEGEFIEDNYPEYLDVFNSITEELCPDDVRDEIIRRVGKLVEKDIISADSVFDLQGILAFDWDSEYVAEAQKVISEKIYDELRKRGVDI